ncbi:MAG: tRNA (guanine-N1)-methyltransferase [Cyanobacteria bacterium J06621_8]
MSSKDIPWQVERKAQFQTGAAFYNPQSRLVRDLGVLAGAVYRQEQGQLRVLDALAGCGVRSLRYWLESKADYLWVNEGNPQHHHLIQQNLAAIPPDRYRLTHQDAHRLFFNCYQERDYYDLVDVDCFGSAAPYLNTMLWATKIGGLMYLTCTDGRTITGHPPEKTVPVYNAIARSHPAIQEQALRILIGAVQQQAATRGLGIKPIFAFFTGQTYRVMLRLVAKPQLTSTNYGFLAYCHDCGNYHTFSWRALNKVGCSCNQPAITVSGAMWLGQLHDSQQLGRMITLANQWGWTKVTKLLQLMQGELVFPPYYYTLGEIGHRGKLDIPQKAKLIKALQEAGYRAAATHIEPEAIKTDAKMEEVVAIASKVV